MSPGSAGTHVCMHACTHTHSYSDIHVYINKMIRHHVICQGRITLGPSFWGPRFFIIALQNVTQGQGAYT